MITVKFWRDNKIAGEFEMEPAEVAEAYRKAVLADPGHHSDGPSHDLRFKWLSWPHTRALVDWMTAPWGLNASWEDRNGFGQICDIVWADPELREI